MYKIKTILFFGSEEVRKSWKFFKRLSIKEK